MPSISTRKIKEMKDVAYQPEETRLSGEEAAYWVVRDPGQNITIIPPYRLGGGEYPKTYGHFHEPLHEETYQVIFGKAGLLLQWMENNSVSKIQLKILNAGEKFTVPSGPGHTLINLGSSCLITLDNHDPSKMVNIYDEIKKTHGLGYYVVEKDGEWEAVPNPAFAGLLPLLKNA